MPIKKNKQNKDISVMCKDFIKTIFIGILLLFSDINAKERVINHLEKSASKLSQLSQSSYIIFETDSVDDIRVILNDHCINVPLFDCDGTLMVYDDSLMDFHNAGNFMKDERNILNDSSDFGEIMANTFQNAPAVVTDLDFPSLIDELQSNGQMPLVLTQCGTGLLADTLDMELWREDQLHQCNYHFENSSKLPRFELTNLYDSKKRFIPTSSNTPVYYNGILFSCDTPKGEVFYTWISENKDYFLDRFQLTSLNQLGICLVDDNINNIESFCNIMANTYKFKTVVGIHYTKSKNTPRKQIDNKFEQYKRSYLNHNKQFLTDNQAAIMFNYALLCNYN